MKERYIKFFKKNVVVLVILLIVVCFSFGISYSNFIYNSNNHRAVEMYVNKLKYNIKINNILTNKIDIPSGNSVVNIEIESLNNVDTYFKLLTLKRDNLDIYYLEQKPNDKINSNNKNIVKLFISNKTDNNVSCEFLVSGGYINNSVDDIQIPNNYQEIINKINVGDNFEYKIDDKTYNLNYDFLDNIELRTINNGFRILNVNDDGSIDLISNESVSINSLKFKGAKSYNNIIYILNTILNELYSSKYTVNVRNISLNDINKNMKSNLEIYSNNIKTYTNQNNIYIPSLYENEIDSIIDNQHLNGKIDKSENNSFIDSTYKIVNSITLKEMNKLNNIVEDNFKSLVYYELFIEKNNKYYNPYYISTRYSDTLEDNVLFGIFSIRNNELYKSNLYDSNNNEYESSLFARPIIRISNKVNLYLEQDVFKINENNM